MTKYNYLSIYYISYYIFSITIATKNPTHIEITVEASIGILKAVILGHKLRKDTIIIPSTKPNNIDLYFWSNTVTNLDILNIPITTPKPKNIKGINKDKLKVSTNADIKYDIFSYSPNINNSKDPDIPGITIATAAAIPHKNNLKQ